jgi:hypothetical protein
MNAVFLSRATDRSVGRFFCRYDRSQAFFFSACARRNTNSLCGICCQRKLMCKHANLLSLIEWHSTVRVAYIACELSSAGLSLKFWPAHRLFWTRFIVVFFISSTNMNENSKIIQLTHSFTGISIHYLFIIISWPNLLTVAVILFDTYVSM